MFLALALGVFQTQPPAPPANPTDDKLAARIEALAREAIDKQGVPGLSIAVAKEKEIVFAKGWGYADAQRGVPATEDTVYDIGTLTHQFLAVAILQLSEQKKLTLDDEISKWLPDFPAQGRKITLRQLLNQTSGVPGQAALAKKHAAEMNRELTREELFALFRDVPPEFDPGHAYSADDSSYLLLALVIAKASGEEYPDYVRTHVLDPIELKHTRFVPAAERPIGLAQDCKQLSGEKELLLPLSKHKGVAAQSLCSTVQDLVRWQRALTDRTLIDEKSTREMTTPKETGDGPPVGNGFGVTVGEADHTAVYSHTGGAGGFRVRLAYYAAPRLTIVVLANCANGPVEKIEKAIAAAALDRLPAEIVDLLLDAQEVALYVGSWQIATARIRTFEKDHKLWFERPGEPAFALMHQGQRVFVASNDRAMRITFKGEEGKPAESFEILRNGLMSVGKRME
jgi:CubicO group peptidase (beta-lactamase class C family)